jgi:hypothetical protein
MMTKIGLPSLLAVAALTLGACATGGSSNTSASAGGDETAVVILPGAGAGAAVQSGCWATFYDERNFNGNSLTLVGPVALQSLDRGSAQQLKRDLKSVVTGPRATLVLYEKQLLSARSVGFQPDSREPGLVEKLGFGGRVESMQLTCS